MGTVWLAERADGAFRKQAAVKVINKEAVRAPLVRRFLRERQILADLEHPNICRLLDGGTTADGRPYLVMERVEGLPIDRYIEQSNATVPRIVRLFAELCDALSFAHTRGVIHRDLKPSNVMVTEGAEPKVLDFGIARLRENVESTLTQTGEMALTPHYASPEQWHGAQIEPSSDVFSLGVMLVESLGGSLPRVPGLEAIEQKALRGARIDADLRSLVLRAVQREPQQRYPTMAKFGEALRGYLGHGHEAPARGRGVRVFLSCRSDVADDLALALSFYDTLAEAGASVFLAPKSTTGSDTWVRAATRAMTTSDVLLLVLSARANVSEMVAREVELARRLNEAQKGKLRIVPVRVGHTEATASVQLLDAYLDGVEYQTWQGPQDTTAIIDAVLGSGAPTSRHEHGPSRPDADPTTDHDPSPPRQDLPGGVVDPQSPYYVVLPLEERCRRELLKPSALIRIKGPRQTGKSSLMTRILAHCDREGVRTVSLNLQLADSAILTGLDRFLRWLCAVVSKQMGLCTKHLDEQWDDLFGPKNNCTAYLEEHVVPGPEPLVLAIDHVDRVFDFPSTAEEFLSLLRAWNEMGKSRTPWSNLRMVLVHATEIYLPMNINHSPFNVGLPVTLSKWDEGTVRELAKRHGLDLGDDQISVLSEQLDGHPHLIRLALYHLARGRSLDDIMRVAATDEGPFADHLKSLLWHLQTQPRLGEFAALVMSGAQPVPLDTELAFKLASLGLVQLQGNSVLPARGLYRDYLYDRLRTTYPSTN